MTITAEQYEATINDTDIEEPVTPPIDPQNPPADLATPPVPPNSETPPSSPPAAPTFNLDEELVKTTGGAIKSVSEISALLDKANKTQELETQLRQFQEENTSLKAKADTNPFANDFTKKLNDLYKSGANESQIQAFQIINRVGDIDALSPMDASTLALQVKHGLTPDEAKAYLNDKYNLDPEDPNAQLTKNDEIKLKIESTADKDFLKTHKAEVSALPENTEAKAQQLYEQQMNQRVQQLEPIAKTVVTEALTNSFKGVSINGKEDDTAIRVDLPISQESRDKLAETVGNMTRAQWENWTPDEKGVEAMKTFSDNVLVLQNYKSWLIDVASKTEMRVRAEYNNPGSINRGKEAPAGGKTSEQEVIANISEAIGL